MGFAPLVDSAVSVQSNVPLPKKHAGRRQRVYPWVEMKIGDSFFVARTQARMAGTAHAAGDRYALKFATRAVTENGVKGVRVWRVA